MNVKQLLDELENVTNDIVQKRSLLITDERVRLKARNEVDAAATELARQKIYAMAASEDAGKNAASRKADAEIQTIPERVKLEEAEARLLDAELHIIEHTGDLRIAEDRRRYLETVVRLMTAEGAA